MIDYEFEPNDDYEEFSDDQTLALRAGWLEVYGKNKRGLSTKKYLWHLFSDERYPSISDQEAKDQYSKQIAANYVVLPNSGERALLLPCKPTSCGLGDYLVFPPNLAWTMAFTHEEGWLGPYFATHKDYKRLNDENLAEIKKEAAKKRAAEQGWM